MVKNTWNEMVNMKDENREDIEKIRKMSAYERLAYLRSKALFMQQLGYEDTMLQEILLVTKGYENA